MKWESDVVGVTGSNKVTRDQEDWFQRYPKPLKRAASDSDQSAQGSINNQAFQTPGLAHPDQVYNDNEIDISKEPCGW